jgi:hypothetical protein
MLDDESQRPQFNGKIWPSEKKNIAHCTILGQILAMYFKIIPLWISISFVFIYLTSTFEKNIGK